MTGKAKIAALLLTLTAVVYGVIPLIVDLSPTHVLHPAWSPHARFHVVWQISLDTMIAMVVLILVWWPGDDRIGRLRIAAVLGCLPLVSFQIAAATRHVYGGEFSEPGGVPSIGGIDANVLTFSPTIAIQIVGLILATMAKEKSS